ncbi:STAS domain-containing protein [Lentzea sp. NPDC003310]|uniref:STAS domain-containing protein n=1 Tax=Lentzea sp. NPDC003310 TaxID=3154447 RepID=UPI0033BAEB10
MHARFRHHATLSLTVRTSHHSFDDALPVVGVTGEIDHRSARLVEAAVLDQVALTPPGVIADLRAVTYLDAAGIKALVSTDEVATGAGVRLAVVAGQDAVMKPLESTGCDLLLDVYEDLANAVRALIS